MTRTKTIAASLAVSCLSLTAAAKARADCPSDCIADLCSARGDTIVTGPLVLEGGELRVEIQTVVRQGPGAAVAVGSRIAAGYVENPQMYVGIEAMVVSTLTPSGDMFARWFSIDGDGHARCRNQSDPPPGRGATAAAVASLAAMGSAACRAGLGAAGYGTIECDDTGCTAGSTSGCGGETAASSLGSPLVLAVGLFVRRRHRRRRGSN